MGFKNNSRKNSDFSGFQFAQIILKAPGFLKFGIYKNDGTGDFTRVSASGNVSTFDTFDSFDGYIVKLWSKYKKINGVELEFFYLEMVDDDGLEFQIEIGQTEDRVLIDALKRFCSSHFDFSRLVTLTPYETQNQEGKTYRGLSIKTVETDPEKEALKCHAKNYFSDNAPKAEVFTVKGKKVWDFSKVQDYLISGSRIAVFRDGKAANIPADEMAKAESEAKAETEQQTGQQEKGSFAKKVQSSKVEQKKNEKTQDIAPDGNDLPF